MKANHNMKKSKAKFSGNNNKKVAPKDVNRFNSKNKKGGKRERLKISRKGIQ